MPSPFPGMDPYLEAPALWPDVHATLIGEMRQALNAQVTPKYFVQIEERVYVSTDTDPGRTVIAPDLRVRQMTTAPLPLDFTGPAIALAEAIEVTHLLEKEVREAYLKIIDVQTGAVVSIVELLSPANKVRGSDGRKDYLRKRRAILASHTHLVEIDLLRRGRGVFPPELVPPHDYLVHLSRAGASRRAWIWPTMLPQPLTPIPVPLRGPDPDATLDLQSALRSAYDRASYQTLIDYRNAPTPPLAPAAAAWADDLLRSKGLRQPTP